MGNGHFFSLDGENDKPAETTSKPQIRRDPMYALLRDGKIKEFNEKRARGEQVDCTNCDFRAVDLRGMNAEGLDFSGSYFRLADLRGVDLSKSRLEGASIHDAQISGVYFPKELGADEIFMSHKFGTRMRYKS